MTSKILLYFASIVFVSQAVLLSGGTCLNGMNEISFSDLAASIQEKSTLYFYKDKILASPLEINMEMEIKESIHASLILSKANPKFFGFKNKGFLEIGIDSIKEDKSKIRLNVKKTSKKNAANSYDKEKIIRLDASVQKKMGDPNKIPDKKEELHHSSIKLVIRIEKNEIKILYSKAVVFSEPIDIQKDLGAFVYVLLESSKEIIKDFSICYSKTSPKSLRNLEENSQLEYIEVDEYSIKTSPNILKGGNVIIIPNVKLSPKDKDGNFPSSLLSLKPKDLRNLFNVTHSKNVSFYYQVAIVSQKQLIIILESDIPGEIHISSNYFKNNITYIMNINNTELVLSETLIEIDKDTLVNGDNSKIKILPKNKYQNLMTHIDESDIEKFQVSITLPNKTVIQAETGKLNPKEKAIIFDPILNFTGEALIEVKYGDTVIPCDKCNINVTNYEIDWQQTKIEYLHSIKLGEISILTIYPRDENGKELKAGILLRKIEIKCILDNKTIEVSSEVNQENNKIEIYNKENITHPGNLTWEIIYGDDIFIYNVSITAEAEISNFKMNVYSNLTNEELKDNNTKLNLETKSDFIITYELVDLFNNKLEKIDNAEVTEVQMLGNYMTPINFSIIRENNTFNFSLKEKDKQDFKDLVSGDNYELKIKVEKDDKIIYNNFVIVLTSSENDEGYGNGNYNISHFTFEPDVDEYEFDAGETFTFYLIVRTEQDLLYHKELDINEHLKFNQTFNDETFTFNASNIDNKLGIFLIEIYSTKATDNEIELEMTFDGQKIEKKIKIIIQGASVPSPNLTEVIYYTNQIEEDIQPIKIYLTLKDDYKNDINRNDIVYKRQLFLMNEDENEKPEQNIDLEEGNKTYILSFIPDYNNISSFNLSVYFNNSNELILIKKDIIVRLKIKTFLEDEELVIDTPYTPGIAFFYEGEKVVNVRYDFEENDNGANDINNGIESRGDFLLYIEDINYEKNENNTKLEYYTAYLAIFQLTNRNTSEGERFLFISDKKLIDIYSQIRNKSYLIDYFYMKNNSTNYTGFIKFEFYENGEIKQMYYPKIDSFNFKSMDYIKEIISLIIPKISPHLFSEDIHSKFNEIQKDITESDSVEVKRNLLLRRLNEINPKKRKKAKNKLKKIRYRVLQEDSSDTTEINQPNASYTEDEILPIEDEIDYELREIKDNGDNTSNITLLYIGDVESDHAKVTGSLDNKTVMTKIDDEGKVLGIYQVQHTHFVSGVRDPDLDEYIYNNTYNEDSYFKKDDFLAENETTIINEGNPINLKNMDAVNHNLVFLLDDFYDDSGQLMAYFDNFSYEIYNETLYTNYVLDEMGPDFLNKINGSNISISITDEIEEDTGSLRALDSNTYPYYGQKIVTTVKDIYEKHFVGVTIRSYVETTVYPDTGITLVETINVLGSIRKVLESEKTYTNNHIVTKNKNTMSNDLINFVDKEIKKVRNYTAQLTEEFSKLNKTLSNEKPYANTYDTLLDDYANQFQVGADVIYNQFTRYLEFVDKLDLKAIRSRGKLIRTVSDALSNIRYENKKKVDSYYKSNTQFNQDVLNLINTYEKTDGNISLELLQEISDDVNIINDLIEDNITRFISSYRNDISVLKNFDKSPVSYILNNRSNEYNTKIDLLMETFNILNFSIPKLLERKNKLIRAFKESSYTRWKDINDDINKVTYYRMFLESANNWSIQNSLKIYLYNKDHSLSNQILNLKGYINLIYRLLHNFLFNFYKEFSDDIFDALDHIKLGNYTSFKKTSFEIIENIINEYKNITKSSSNNEINQHKKQINEYLSNYNKTVSKHLCNFNFDEIIKNYIPSNEFWGVFNKTLKNLINSFESYGEDFKSFQEYPSELDYMILTLKTFKDELKEITEEINKYAYEAILYEIDIMNGGNKEYIFIFVKSDKNYLFNNLDRIKNLTNYINISQEKSMLEEFFPNSNDTDDEENVDNFVNEKLKNFSFINEDTLTKFETIITDTIDKFNKTRNVIYNYYYQINCSINECSNSNYITDKNLRNRFMRTRLEMLISYMDSFTENTNNTYKEKDINNFLNPEINFNEIMENNFISELNENALQYIKTDLEDLYKKIDSDIFLMNETYNDINYTDILLDYNEILNDTDELFLNMTETQFYRYNSTIYSLIEKYKDILYKYIEDYNYTIISFDIYQNYFNNFLKNISNKYDLIETKINLINQVNHSLKTDDDYFDKDFKKNITSLFNQRKDSLTNLLKNNDVKYKIMDKDFSLYEYIYENIPENNINNVNLINNTIALNNSKFMETLTELIHEIRYPTEQFLKNITNEFLIQFKNGQNLTDQEKEDAINAYENIFNLKNNNTYRKCWNLRGKFLAEIIKEDYINYNEYLNYNNKIQVIEECEAEGNLNCPYDRADLEEAEFTNLTDLYNFCNEINKIYGQKQSVFYSMEDLDVEELNEINDDFVNVLDKIFYFDEIINDYIYNRFGLKVKESFNNETINIEETSSEVNNTINNGIYDIQEKYDEFIIEQISSKLKDIFEFYQTMIYSDINCTFSIFADMKNTFFVNYYYKKYQLFKDLFKDLIKNMTYINLSFKNNLKDVFPEIEEDQDNISSSNWKEDTEAQIYDYYANEFPDIFIQSFFNLIKEKVVQEKNITYLHENLENIINKSESNYQYNEVKSEIVFGFSAFNSFPLGFTASIEKKKKESIDNSEIENLLNRIGSIDVFLQKRELEYDYNQIKKRYLNNISLVYESFDLENILLPIFNGSIYTSFDLNDGLDDVTAQLKKVSEVSFDPDTLPDFFSIAYNKSFDYYKDIYAKIQEFYYNMIKIIGNVSIYNNTDNIEDKFGELAGYAMIERLAYIDPICNENGCPFKIDMVKSKEEMKQNQTRRLSTNRFKKEVKEVVRVLKEMNDMQKNDSDYIFKIKRDKKRKLSENYNYEIYENYDSTCPERGKKEVDMIISLLKSAVDDLNEKFYYYSKTIENEISKKFKDELSVLENKYFKYLNALEKLFSAQDYGMIASNFTNLMYKLNNYVGNITGSIISISGKYMDIINDFYSTHQITGEMISNKISAYYRDLDTLIGAKYSDIKEEEYVAASSYKNSESNLQKQYEVGKVVLLKTVEIQSEMEIAIKNDTKKIWGWIEDDPDEIEITALEFNDYDWQDADNANEKWDPEDKHNYMMRTKPKEEQNKKESAFVKKGKELEKKMDDLNLKFESEIKVNWHNLLNSTITTTLGFDRTKEIKSGWQHPFFFAGFPILQLRMGFKVSIYFRTILGLIIDMGNFGDDFEIKLKIKLEFRIGAKLDLVAELGLYAGIASVYGGVEGTFFDANVGFRFMLHIFDKFYEIYINLSINAFQCRYYVEAAVNLFIYKTKAVLIDEKFGLEVPLLNVYSYVKKDFNGQLLASKKDCESIRDFTR